MNPEQLSPDERQFLQGLLKLYREYYSTLIANHGCTPANRAKYHFIEALWRKLSPKTPETNDSVL